MSKLAKRLDAHFVACAAAAGAAAVGVTQNADAAIVWSGPVNINIPSTTSGVYLNVATGVNNPSPGLVPGWDVNPWSSTSLNQFSQTGGGHVTTGTNTQYDNMTAGTLISAASAFSLTGTATINPATPLNLSSSDNLVGFRFANEGNGGLTHYGWMRISLSSTAQGQPRAIVEYAYEDVANVGILAGAVPAPGSLALLALGAVGVAGRRRK